MIKSATAISLALGLLSAPVMAGEFFTGTRSNSSRFDSTRVSTGTESVKANRNYRSQISGSSHKTFINVSATAENARNGQRGFSFIEGDSNANAALISTGNGIFGAGAGGGGGTTESETETFNNETTTTSSGGGEAVGFGAQGQVSAAGGVGSEIDGMSGGGRETYLDGSLQASLEYGGARTEFRQQEDGRSVYKMNGTFSEVMTEDGNKSSGGSVFSIN
jgi:hypothetical protein